jgi:hypothetical protein
MLFQFLREAVEALTSETENPSIFQHDKLDRHREDIQRLCGEHGMLEAVKGRPDTFECNGIRFAIVEDTVITL